MSYVDGDVTQNSRMLQGSVNKIKLASTMRNGLVK